MPDIRVAKEEDREAIAAVLCDAFESDAEARLVDMLEADGDVIVSLVAEDEAEIIGHVLLSRLETDADDVSVDALALAPVAVRSDRQGEGVGGRLVEAATLAARQLGHQAIFLLGEPEYYARFGYEVDAAKPFATPYAGDYWQVLILDETLRETKDGVVRHAAAFAKLGEA